MTTIKAEQIEGGGCKLPDDFVIPQYANVFCDGQYYYFFETKEESDAFYDERGITHD